MSRGLFLLRTVHNLFTCHSERSEAGVRNLKRLSAEIVPYPYRTHDDGTTH